MNNQVSPANNSRLLTQQNGFQNHVQTIKSIEVYRKGKLTLGNGDVLKGRINNQDLFEGKVKATYKTGGKAGFYNYKKGRIDGPYETFKKKGIEKGNYTNGKINGPQSFHHSNGNVFLSVFEDGIQEGKTKYTLKNGIVIEKEFSKGKLQNFPRLLKFPDGSILTMENEHKGTLEHHGYSWEVTSQYNPDTLTYIFTTKDGAKITYTNGQRNDPPVPYTSDDEI